MVRAELFKQVEDRLSEGRVEEALALTDQIPADDTDYKFVLFLKGNIYLWNEEYDQAQSYYRQALSNGFKAGDLYYNWAVAEMELSHYENAEELYRQAFELAPEDIAPLSQIAQIRLWRKEFKGAEAVFEEMMEKFPEKYEGFHFLADMLIGSDNIEEAEAFLLPLEEQFSGNAVYVYDRSRVMSAKDQKEEAFYYLKERSHLFQGSDNHRYMYKKACGRLLMQIGDLNSAMPIWVDLFENDGDHEAGTYLISGAVSAGEYELALETADRIMADAAHGKDYLLALYFKAVLLEVLGREEERQKAVELFENTVRSISDIEKDIEIVSLQVGVNMLCGKKEKSEVLLPEIEKRLMEHAGNDAGEVEQAQKIIATLREQAGL